MTGAAAIARGSGGGLFITLEGIDGAGKSTHLTAMRSWLGARHHRVVQTREPGGSELAESLRGLVLHHDMDPLTEALLVFAARRDHLRRTIEPALADGATVLSDRYTDASFAYQGGGRGLALPVLLTLQDWVQGGRDPDLTLWLDLPPAVAAARRAAARDPDRFEAQDTAFFERVQAAYRRRADEAPRRVVRIDAMLAPDAVWQQIEHALKRRVPA